jgi:hypothetical protein
MGNTIRADIMDAEEAITAIKTALEQPEQAEPVAWMVTTKDGRHFIFRMNKPATSDGETLTPLYTHPPRREWQELTREGINKMMAAVGWQNAAIRQADLDKVEKVVRAIEAALRRKNHE